jgi:hypothetical protein
LEDKDTEIMAIDRIVEGHIADFNLLLGDNNQFSEQLKAIFMKNVWTKRVSNWALIEINYPRVSRIYKIQMIHRMRS